MAVLLVGHPKLGELAEGDEIRARAYNDGIAVAGGRTLEKWVYYQPMLEQVSHPKTASPFSELRAKGAFGFPQQDAKVLCDRPTLRFSVWNNDRYLLAQAVLWTDGDSSPGESHEGREVADRSELVLDLDADGKETPDVDRVYRLNASPRSPGLRYTISKGVGKSTGLKGDTQGRGAIRYAETAEGTRVRVDTYLIPLQEISRRVGDKIRMCYYGRSPKPPLTVNSVTYDLSSPRSRYHEYLLVNGGEIDPTQIPDGQDDASLSEH